MRCPSNGRARGGRAAALALALALSLAGPRDAGAASLEGVAFADRVQAGDVALDLHALALLRYRVLFRAYVAGLYVAAPSDTEAILDDVPKRLELSYFWPIAGADFGPAADALLARNVPAERLARLRPRIERLHGAYRDVEPGDRYALTYLPGRGTELALNGRPLVAIEGADFAAAYFSIWLGERPLDEGLRDALLGRGD